MGIKEREGRFEIKGRSAELGAHALAPGIEGVAERWCKWSYEAAADRGPAVCQGPGTIVVAKAREQRHFLLRQAAGRRRRRTATSPGADFDGAHADSPWRGR